MSQIELFVFRHGQTDWNSLKRLQGHSDIPLNQTGLSQAKHLAAIIARLNPQVIITSDLLRAKQTAEMVNLELGITIIETESLRECYLGDAEGDYKDELATKYGPDAWNKWLSIHKKDELFSFPNGETKRDHLKRMLDFLEEYMRTLDGIKRVAVSTHGGSLLRLAHHCQNAPPEAVPISNCVCYQIYFDTEKLIWNFGRKISK